MKDGKIQVTHVSSAPFSGGAARAGFRLHQGLSTTGNVLSTWLDASSTECDASAIRIPPPTPRRGLVNAVRRRLRRPDPFKTLPRTTTTCSNPAGWGKPEHFQNIPVPDVWNLHWVAWFMEWETLLPWMAEQAPIVWTLHDLNPLRGVWHYDPTEKEVQSAWGAFDAMWSERKRNAFSKIPKDRLTFVGPSRWIVDQVRQCPATSRFDVHHIPYGIDTTAFREMDRTLLRGIAEIEDDWLVLGFLADTLDDPRKGLAELYEAVRSLPESLRIHVVTAGRGSPTFGNVRHTHLGPLQSDRLLAVFYSGCDLFVCPSLQDNLPNTVIESLCCGTPVVSFNVGGLPDMVRSGQTGLTSSQASSDGLSAAIVALLNDSIGLERLRTESRRIGSSDYKKSLQASRYDQLYCSLYKMHAHQRNHSSEESQ